MPLYTRVEFAKLCGIESGNLSNVIKRGNVVLSGEFIDDSIAVNRQFMQKRAQLLARKGVPEAVSKHDKVGKPNLTDAHNLVDEKTQADIERIRTVTELNRLKIAKQEGENIPTELVMPLVAQFAHSMIGAFKNGMEAMLVEIGHKKKLTNAEMADLRKVLTATINRSAQEGVEDARKATGNIVNEFIEKRGKGERL
jgi:uncharacterized protein YcgL (UPF0745 family)